MELPTDKTFERLAGIIIIGLLIGIITTIATWINLQRSNNSEKIPIEKALYVTDYHITKIYGPGTPQQATILKQLKLDGTPLFYKSHVLYRMGLSPGAESSQGILMIGFDPAHPETAYQLKSAP